ncbi:hypothetical protein B0H14DRAFT_1011667 [Mycena olivaceomarginata]|nr:hypothetical protein B0H14DRAFT_1011667 [Mycena olivaceomarginata]
MHKVSHPVVLEGRRLHWPMAAALSCPNILSRPTEVRRRGGSRIDATQQQKTDCVEAIGVYTVATPKLDSKRRWVTKCVPMLRWTYGGQQYRREANRHSIEVTQKSGLTEGLPCHSMKERRLLGEEFGCVSGEDPAPGVLWFPFWCTMRSEIES